MKLLFKSDLHLDFHVKFNKNQKKMEKEVRQYARNMYLNTVGEEKLPVLLGGDFGNINHYAKWYLDELSKLADHLFVVFGNHDYYVESKSQTSKYEGRSINRVKEIKDYFKDYSNITFLEKFEVVEYKGLKIAGATNWYKLDSFMQRMQFKMMNDSAYIRNYDIGHEGFLEDGKFDELEQVDVMLTHVCPIYTESNHLKGAECYVSDRDLTKARHWFAGHVHEVNNYEKAGSFLHTNANGYNDELETKKTAHTFGVYEV